MRRRATLVLAVVVACGIIGAALTAGTHRSDLAFTLGVPASGVAVELLPRQTACQGPIGVPPDGDFEQVELQLGTYGGPGPALEASVKDVKSGRIVARGTIRGGYPDVTEVPRHRLRVGTVTAGSRVRVCLTNQGRRRVAVYGSGGAASRTTTATVDGAPVDPDLLLVFRRSAPRSLLSTASAIAERASLFKARWVEPWTFGILALLVVLAVPLLVWRALRAALPAGD